MQYISFEIDKRWGKDEFHKFLGSILEKRYKRVPL